MAPAAPPGRPWFFEMKQVESLKWEAYYHPRNGNTRNQALAACLSCPAGRGRSEVIAIRLCA